MKTLRTLLVDYLDYARPPDERASDTGPGAVFHDNRVRVDKKAA